MIGLLKGELFYKNEQNIIIMCGGVGYKVEAVNRLQVANIGEEITAYIYTHVREDAIKLFGFSSEEELQTFEMLLSVSGVGPKGAMNIISTIGVDGVYDAVLNEDPKAFKGVSGIGTKNAEKIIIELKSKIKNGARTRTTDTKASPARYSQKAELEDALVSLGYSIGEIREIEKEIEYKENVADMVKSALILLKK